MKVQITADVEEELQELDRKDPDAAMTVWSDLEAFGRIGIEGVDIVDIVGSWVRLDGLSGRTLFWVAPLDDDVWRIESFAVI